MPTEWMSANKIILAVILISEFMLLMKFADKQ